MTDANSDVDSTADAEGEAEELPQPFENRAARRSKGKGTANRTGHTTSGFSGRSSTVQSPRQYGTRRSG